LPHHRIHCITETLLALHILAATVALLAGYLALWATKGPPLHRRSGMVFAVAMFLMSLSGAWIASVRHHSNSVVAGLFTFYFVATALLTVRRPGAVPAWVHPTAMWVAATSFFRGPPNRVPEIIRYSDFYPIPIFTPLIVMFFWLWRVRRSTQLWRCPKLLRPRLSNPLLIRYQSATLPSFRQAGIITFSCAGCFLASTSSISIPSPGLVGGPTSPRVTSIPPRTTSFRHGTSFHTISWIK
jgi:uncharacterized membrane protein